MACIKGVNRSASVALSPESPYMAAGTMAGAVDLSFSSSANLEIFKLDFQSDDLELPMVGESPSSERFNRLAWGKNGSGSEEFCLGVIAGGLVDGNIDIWNPHSLMRSQAGETALVGHLSRHKGPVRGLEFNSFTPNLLASGADDGEICIWDLAKPAEPSHFPPLKGSGSAAQGEISFLSWNSKVQHILASTSYNGTTVVWDLKKQKPVISFTDSVRRRCSVLQWNPDMATQLIVASDDDSSPTLRLWDMRNIISPVKEFVGHTKGVIGMEWCPIDSSFLLTCAKDNRTICWDTATAEMVTELPAGTNWNFDVHWYPRIPGIISASSFDGKIGIYNIEGCSHYGSENYNNSARLRAPKWYKCPVGVSFGFGGKLVSFLPRQLAGGATGGTSEVFVHNLVTEQTLVNRSSEFGAAIENGERSSLRVICENKLQEAESDDDRETWGFLKVMLDDDVAPRTKLLSYLGFSVPTEEEKKVEDVLASEVNGISLDAVADDKAGFENKKEAVGFALDNGEDFFNNLPSPKAETPVSASASNFAAADTDASPEAEQQIPDEPEEIGDPLFDDAVQRALVVGDYKGAVAQCISKDRMADALVIAHVGGASLWESTRDQYLKKACTPYMKIVSAMVNNDLKSLVNTRPLKFWKETLALLCTFAQNEEWAFLCDMLALKLISAGNTLAATLCYICAGNIDKTVLIWSKSLAVEQGGKSYVNLLQDLMEKAIVLALATGNKQSTSLCKLVENYIEVLASQGLLSTAMTYLQLLGSDELSPELGILRHRIALSAEPELRQKHDTLPQQAPMAQVPMAQVPMAQVPMAQVPMAQVPMAQVPSPQVPLAQVPMPHAPSMQNSLVQVPSAPQASFAQAPAVTQPTMRTTFVPSTPPSLRNADQYQQPTLGSQLYPGSGNPPFPIPSAPNPQGSMPPQAAQVPGPKVPQTVSPAPQAMGFMPVPPSSGVPRAGTVQPPSPTLQASSQSATTPAAAAPPPTVRTADISNVPAHQKPIIATLTKLFNETSEALGGARANPAKKREIDDNSRKIGALFSKLNSNDISKNAADKLTQLCLALDKNDFGTALQIQILLTTTEWDECNFWLATLKRMIKTRQNMR